MSSNRHSSPDDDDDDDAWPVWRATKQRAVAGDFSDLVVECGGQQHNVHKLIMAASPFFAKACNSPFKEAREGIVRLPDDDPAAVKAMVDYLYHGCYGQALQTEHSESSRPCPIDCGCQRPNEASNPIQIDSDSGSDDTSSDGSDSSSESNDSESIQGANDQENPVTRRTIGIASPLHGCERQCEDTSAALACFDLPLDAMVYALGEKYDLPNMKELALENFQDTMGDTPRHVITGPFREAAIIAYDSTPDTDRGMRELVVWSITHFKYASDSPEIKKLLEDIPSLRVDVSIGLFKFSHRLRQKVKRLEKEKKARNVSKPTRPTQESSKKRKR